MTDLAKLNRLREQLAYYIKLITLQETTIRNMDFKITDLTNELSELKTHTTRRDDTMGKREDLEKKISQKVLTSILMKTCQEQHKAIDWLAAQLIKSKPDFYPSKSPIWPIVIKGNAAIALAEKSQPCCSS